MREAKREHSKLEHEVSVKNIFSMPFVVLPILGSSHQGKSARKEQMTEMSLDGSVLADRRALRQPLATLT